jgi:hypothetical protein
VIVRLECRRIEELLSDHVEGTLDAVLRAEVDVHLAGCEECRSLRESLVDVLDVLQRPPEMEPGPALAARVAAASFRAARQRVQVAVARRIPVRIQAVAAVFAIGLSAGLFLLGASPGGAPAREVPLSARITEARDSLIETRDRVVEDYHVARVLVGTLFEGRLDRVGERVEDYRKLLERRRRASPAPRKTESEAAPTNLNDGHVRAVTAGVREQPATKGAS